MINKFERKEYAPVIIPTLSRYSHFKECLESLMQCRYAHETDVYIGLDYPLSKSHWDGYNKIVRYLTEIQGKHNFKTLQIIKRERNYGIGRNGNVDTLINSVLENHNSFILSEDDNVFAPAFLDFINTGLELYWNDKKTLAICGYSHGYDIKYSENTIFRQNIDFSAWGFGIWKDRWQILRKLDCEWFRAYFSIKTLHNLKFFYGNNRLLDYLGIIRNSNLDLTDNMFSIYMALTNTNVVMPIMSLVRNNGWDGSGVHCIKLDYKKIFSERNNKLCRSNNYEILGTGYEFYNYNKKAYKKQSYARISNIEMFKRIIIKIRKRLFLL